MWKIWRAPIISGGTALYTEEITDPQASNADILPNEEVRAIDLLYAMMLPSANEAAKNVGYFLGTEIDNSMP